MSRRIEHSSSYAFPVTQVHAGLITEQYWRDRLDKVGGPGATLEQVTTGPGTISVAMSQSIPAEHLPSIVSKVRPGDLVIKRTETWGTLDGDHAEGTFTAEVVGAPATISGTQTLKADGSRANVQVEGKAEVRIPLIGGKIENAIADEVLRLIAKEQEFTEQWLGS
ncbi:DUF2505 domain-containing protein [Rhodococcus sp. USK10]|uniref:DUF2505 domain-containing protein n=1 Tax=Rhodococcus sp. USK10 TaxID=2789739 RepID=UPI001C601779|nr:DUF2505 domain-containing protein [Rhodococcus sp. USK10]QYB06067.1 DUF2505 domain-containing protein [Rhodococcus sp. USK10]